MFPVKSVAIQLIVGLTRTMASEASRRVPVQSASGWILHTEL